MKNKKYLIATASVVLIAVVCIIFIRAYLYSPQSVQNDFTPAKITCRVDEVFRSNTDGTENKNVKETVTVANTGTHDAYIRVIAVTYWQDTKGNVVEKGSADLDLENIVDTTDQESQIRGEQAMGETVEEAHHHQNQSICNHDCFVSHFVNNSAYDRRHVETYNR